MKRGFVSTSNFTSRRLIIVFLLAMFLRLMLIPNPGFEADISFWKSWGLAAADRGVVWAMHNTNSNYPTPFTYLLGAMVKVYSLLADPHNFNEFWSNTNTLFLTIAKLPAILADLGIALFILWLGRNSKRLSLPQLPIISYQLLAVFYLLNPVALIDGAWWGQVDSVGVFIFLLAVGALLKKQPFWAGLLYVVALMTKLQNMIYGPLFFLLVWQLTGYPGMIKSFLGAVIAFFGLNLEFLLARDMGRVIDSLTANYDYFPLLSLNAYNLWWIVAAGAGMQVSDKIATSGIINAKTMGLILFSALYLFAIIHLWRSKDKIRGFWESLIVAAGAFFLFQTQSHDRYAFPLVVFLLLWAPFLAASGKLRIFLIFYSIFSLFYFYNLHTSLVVNYPHNGLPGLSGLTQTSITMGVAFVFLALYAVFLWAIRKQAKTLPYLASVLFAATVIMGLNLPLLVQKPVLLSKLTPVVSQQDYGGLAINKSVNSSFGTSGWNRLSTQYFFYRQGLGTHANSQIVYDINRRFRRFTTDFGIDTEAGTQASAVFEIWGDERLLYRSGKMGRFDLPRHAEVNVSSVRLLKLIITDAGDGKTDDHTDWLQPTLWP